MRWKPKRQRTITRGFAFLPTYIQRTKEYVWFEKIFIFRIDTAHGSAYWYDTDYKLFYKSLYYGCVRPLAERNKKE